MSLATRCNACGTVFRVVQDQLKVSEGWVRCGRCNEVFNALEGLFDLERESPPEWSPPEWSPSQLAPAEPTGPSLIEKIDAQLKGSIRSDADSTPAARIDERDRLEFPDAQFDPDLLAEDSAADADTADAAPAEPEAPAQTPEFLRRAQREARWHSLPMRAALGLAAGVLTAALLLQAGHHFRDFTAARWPALQPALTAWCELLSCRIEAPRRIEDVSVESTALTRSPIPDAFKLSVALRNRGPVPVALPSVDLSLTDPAGQLVARRMLAPRDFGANSAALLQPGAESAWQLLLTTGSARVTGYTVEVFYP